MVRHMHIVIFSPCQNTQQTWYIFWFIFYSMKSRISITVRREIYSRLRTYGHFGESFSELISRILDDLEKIDLPNRNRMWTKLELLSSTKTFDFVSRNCRIFNHAGCYGRWAGLGLHVICSCSCHERKELEISYHRDSNSLQSSSRGNSLGWVTK